MTTAMLLMSDTHVPNRARDLPPSLWSAVDAADVVVHAGDWVSAELVERLSSRARLLIGVYGNNDGEDVRRRLPEVAQWEMDGVRFAAVHETGPAAGRELRTDARFPGTDVLVFGHSHIPWDTTTPAGMRLLNPGSPTDRRRQPTCSFQLLRLDAGAVSTVELVLI